MAEHSPSGNARDGSEAKAGAESGEGGEESELMQLSAFLAGLINSEMDSLQVIDQIERHFLKVELRGEEILEELKQRREILKRENRQLRTEQVDGIIEKSELENHFVECLREVKRETLKRRFLTLERSGMDASGVSFNPNSEDEYAQDKQKILDIIVTNDDFTRFLFDLVFGGGS